jgi:hypothetical protein
MNGHTPGPWEAQDGEVVCKSGDVADVYGFHETEKGADARLIAAAPELLAALKGAITVMEWLDTLRHTDPNFPALDNARSAIAKAEGGSK